ncbi:MAG: hypothetical protein JSS91_10775 [Bacteroidetes bacterium]|nr:hypothetical protein [Bacteroidota bacterium]
MNWKVILQLSLLGLLVGILSIFGIVNQTIELIVWLIIGVFSGYVIHKKMNKLIFTHSVITGLFMGILSSVIQSVFFNTYLKNNPSSLDGLKNIPAAMEPQYILLFSGPFLGIIFGVIIGLIAIAFNKFSK